MSAETLRKAAALMRERATAATAGPWEALVLGSEGYAVVQSADPSVKRRRKRPASVTYETFDECRADAEHIASWHPAVALDFAKQFSRAASDHPDCAVDDLCEVMDLLVPMARAFLGEA